MPKTIIILSGGMDSVTLLYEALAAGHEVEALGVDYRQRHGKELRCAEEICRGLGVRFDLLDLSGLAAFLTGSSQTDPLISVPFGRYDEPSMKLTVVPNRNMVMLAAAAAVAIARKADAVAYGAHAGDHAIYPDCRPEFVRIMGEAFGICDWRPVQLLAPYISLTKGEICQIGIKLGVPYERTWTCYLGEEKPCGRCGSCTERAEAFAFAGHPDPLLAEGSR